MIEIIVGVVVALFGALGLLANSLKNQRDKERERAISAEKTVESVTERANVQTDLGRALHQSEVLGNELIKNRSKEQPPAGRDFNRNRVRSDANKD